MGETHDYHKFCEIGAIITFTRVMGEISRVRDVFVHESHLETRVSHLKIAPENHTPGHLVRAALYTCKMYRAIAV